MQTMTGLQGKYYLILILICLILTQNKFVFSQTDNTQLFNNIKVRSGLPVNEIFAITQDSTGFMWFGTINGLVRYDGYEMKVFRKGNMVKTAFPDNQVTTLAADANLGLWIGSYEGLTYLNSMTNESKIIDLGKPREVRCLLNQNDSVLWVGTSEGLIRLNKKDWSYKIFNTQNSRLGSNIVRALYADEESNIWVGTFNGLNIFSNEGEILFFDLKGNYKPELKNNLILDIEPYTKDNDSKLWIGTETGLVLFDRKSFKSQVFNTFNSDFQNEVVKCIFPLKNGNVYFGTDFGFYHFNSVTGESMISTHDPFNNYSLANNVVWDIFEDNAGILWLATSNGISQLNITQSMFKFTPVFNMENNNLVGNQVNDIYPDKSNNIWLATKKGVVVNYSNGTTETFSANKNSKYPLVLDNINTITGDNLGRIWIGSAGGINIWDPEVRKMHTITADFDINKGLRSNYISTFITPSDGSFWVITWGGGMYKAKGNFSDVDQIYFEYVADFNTNLVSSDKNIWLEDKNKIYTIDLTTLQIKQPDKINEYINDNEINSIHVSSKGDLWIGLTDKLIKYNTHSEEITNYDVFTGNDSYINNLTEDFNGDIWGTTLTSIFRFSTTKNQIESFPTNKWIPLDIFLTKSCFQSHTGELFFGGNDGFISFNPKVIRKNMFQPKTIITNIKVNNKPVESFGELKGRNTSDEIVPYSKKVILKNEQNSVSIGFSSLHFGDPFRNIYAYKLEGYDKEWNYTTGFQNFATYSNLSPDKYIFKVKGTNNDGVWFENQAELEIMVKPPLWASAWAIVLYILILQLFLTMLYLTYRNKVQWKEQLRNITLEKEKNEEISQAKQLFFTNISHEFRTPLNLIMGPVQTVLEKHETDSDAKSLLKIALKNSRRLFSLVNQLMDIRKAENKTLKLNTQEVETGEFFRDQYELFADLAFNQNIKYTYTGPDKLLNISIDVTKLESIIQNLLSNAFKFTGQNGSIDFKVDISDDDLLKIIVSDTGTGIEKEEQQYIFNRFYQGKNSSVKQGGYGIGLNLAKEYCELMGGRIWFESEAWKETVFYVEIPVNKAQSSENKSQIISEISINPGATLREKKSTEFSVNQDQPVILIADDHPDTIEYIKLSLGKKYTFISAPNGKEALKLLEKKKVDLIISDIMMPEVDGLTLCEQVKSNPRHDNIPVILLTAMTMTSHQIEGYKAGADSYITKPFSMDVLDAGIGSLISRSRKVNEYIKQKLIVENQDVEIESHDEKLLQETIRFINEHISDPEINIEKMCKTIGISHSSLYRKIKTQTGMTLNELIRQIKLKRAAQLIKSKKMTISEIMDETGFTNHSYFAKCFKNEFNMSPREYSEKSR